MRRRWPLVAALLWVLFTFWPLLSVLIATTVARANGCQLDESQVHSCVIAGWDAGELLTTLGLLGWLGMVTLPLGAGLGAVGLGVGLLLWAVKRGRRRGGPTPGH